MAPVGHTGEEIDGAPCELSLRCLCRTRALAVGDCDRNDRGHPSAARRPASLCFDPLHFRTGIRKACLCCTIRCTGFPCSASLARTAGDPLPG